VIVGDDIHDLLYVICVQNSHSKLQNYQENSTGIGNRNEFQLHTIMQAHGLTEAFPSFVTQ